MAMIQPVVIHVRFGGRGHACSALLCMERVEVGLILESGHFIHQFLSRKCNYIYESRKPNLAGGYCHNVVLGFSNNLWLTSASRECTCLAALIGPRYWL